MMLASVMMAGLLRYSASSQGTLQLHGKDSMCMYNHILELIFSFLELILTIITCHIFSGAVLSHSFELESTVKSVFYSTPAVITFRVPTKAALQVKFIIHGNMKLFYYYNL